MYRDVLVMFSRNSCDGIAQLYGTSESGGAVNNLPEIQSNLESKDELALFSFFLSSDTESIIF